MTLTFDSLTLNMYGRWGVMCSIYVPKLSQISQYLAELLMINDRYFVRFRRCSNAGMCVLEKRGAIGTKFGGTLYTIIATHLVKNVKIS